jgi:hypothetical protein
MGRAKKDMDKKDSRNKIERRDRKSVFSDRSIAGLTITKTKRDAILYLRVAKENKEFFTDFCEKRMISTSECMDEFLTKLREKNC